MRILKHFTANDEQLIDFPFKRELSMESYLVENESILALDNEFYSDVEIIEEELTLKEGRKSQDTDGRIDLLVTYNQEHIGIVELKLGTLQEIHLKQLEDYLAAKDQLLNKFPDIIDQEVIKSPKWIGVLIGDSIDPKLANKILNGYITASDHIPIAALTINRFKGKRGDIFVTTDIYFKDNRSQNDNTKYYYSNKTFGKGKLVLEVVRNHIADNPNITYSQLEKDFPKECQGSSGVFATSEKAHRILTESRDKRKRHFLNPDELIELAHTTIAISNQWGIGNINKFIIRAKKLGYKIT